MASPTKEELTSSSSSTRQWSHDIFLSFRGEDTRYGFTGHLYTALCNHGLNTFFDTNLERGEEISKELLKSIEMSMISIVVLSENYASSTWCLDELVKIFECRNTGRIRKVYPIFYKVTPSEVRKNEGKFGIALDNHEEKFKDDMEKVKGWKEALTEVANLSGREYKNGEYESEFIKRIIEEISSIKSIHIKLPIAKYPIEVYSQAEAIESLLDVESNGVFVVGIYGLGGVGKTTISKAVYNRINDCFEGSCFLENVRENSKTDAGIIQLQERLLSKILRSSIVKVNSVLEGITMIKERFCNKKVLLILDDVDQSKEIENLLEYCNWLASGSRVVITTRDKNVLPNLGRDPQIRTYEVQKMNPCDARVLFNMHAFGNNNPNQGYSNLVEQIISYADGLPLALVIMGSDLYGKSIDQWTCAVEKYKKIPHGEIINKLKISYDGLENRQRDIFLDIACFFKGFKMDEVVNILDACNLSSSLGISKLIEKCLITVDKRGILWMHDLLQQMGREIIEQESDELENRSRIWCYEDAYKLLTENMGSNKIRGIMWYSPKPRLVKLQADAFKNMRNLKFLLVKNVRISKGLKYLPNELRLLQWSEYDFLLPLKFYPHNLVVLNMPNSQIRLEKLLKQGRAFEALKDVNVCGCKFITKLPSLLCALNLKNLYMRDCVNLIEVHESVGELDKLERWDLAGCRNLEILPSLLGLRSLEYLNLENCGLARLKTIRIENCKQLREIPTLPQSVRCVFVCGCPSVDPQSFSRLLIQFGGARSNISMDPKVSTEIPPTKMSSPFHDSDSESEDEDEDENLYSLSLPLTEIPKDLKFNHQTFGNSVSFWVGKKFSKLAICIAFRTVEAHMHYNCKVNISINGYKQILDIGFFVNWIKVELRLLSIRFEKLKKQKLSEQNHIEVEVLTSPGNSIDLIKWLGVNLECTCYPQNSDVTCLPLPCAMNGCGSSSIPNDTELPPLLPVSSTSYASDSDHRVLNNGRNLSKKTQWKKLRTCWSRTPKVKKNLSLTAEPSRGRSSNPWRWSSSLIKSLLHFPNNT